MIVLVRIKEVLIVTYMMQNEVRKARLTCIELMDMCDGNSSFYTKANSITTWENHIYSKIIQRRKCFRKAYQF